MNINFLTNVYWYRVTCLFTCLTILTLLLMSLQYSSTLLVPCVVMVMCLMINVFASGINTSLHRARFVVQRTGLLLTTLLAVILIHAVVIALVPHLILVPISTDAIAVLLVTICNLILVLHECGRNIKTDEK